MCHAYEMLTKSHGLRIREGRELVCVVAFGKTHGAQNAQSPHTILKVRGRMTLGAGAFFSPPLAGISLQILASHHASARKKKMENTFSQ